MDGTYYSGAYPVKKSSDDYSDFDINDSTRNRMSENSGPSMNKLMYDVSTYKKALQQSTGPFEYVMNPMMYNNCKQCRMQIGTRTGTIVSTDKFGRVVDVESDLRGQTRMLSQDPALQYHP